MIKYFLALMCIVVVNSSSADMAVKFDDGSEISVVTPNGMSVKDKPKAIFKLLAIPSKKRGAYQEDPTYTAKNPVTRCYHLGNPTIITLPPTCGRARGSYCHTSIKCKLLSNDEAVKSWFLCKANPDGTCPDAVKCYTEEDEKITNNLKVSVLNRRDLGTIKTVYVQENTFTDSYVNIDRKFKRDHKRKEKEYTRLGIESRSIPQRSTASLSSSGTKTGDSSSSQSITRRAKSTGSSGGFSVFAFLKRIFGGGSGGDNANSRAKSYDEEYGRR